MAGLRPVQRFDLDRIATDLAVLGHRDLAAPGDLARRSMSRMPPVAASWIMATASEVKR